MHATMLEKNGRSIVGLTWLAAALTAAAGCDSQPQADSGDGAANSSSPGAVDSSPQGQRTPAEIVAEKRSTLDEQYVVGPTAADVFGYRVVWDTTPRLQDVVTLATLQGDSLLLVDAENTLTRLMRDNGRQTWDRPVGSVNDHVLGLSRSTINGFDVVMALTEGDLHVFEAGNGVQTDRQSLSRVANTAGALFGPALIYGSLNGQLIWHHFELKSYMGGTSLYGAISATPMIQGDVLVGVTQNGNVMAVDAGSRVRLWDKMARDAIAAPPAVSDDAVWVSSLDQHIRCYNINNGQVMWDHLHSGPLSQPPILIGDKILLQTPDMGLVCYEALPYGDLDGNILWSTEDAKGTLFGRHRGRLLAWDQASHHLEIIDEQGGSLIDRISLPKMERLIISDFESGDIYCIAANGQTTKIVPRQ